MDDERLFGELLAEYLGARLSELALSQAVSRLRVRAMQSGTNEPSEPDGPASAQPPLASALRLSTHSDAVNAELTDPSTILGAVATMMAGSMRRGGVRLDVTIAPELPSVSCRPAAVEQALVYLLAHAQRAVAHAQGTARHISLEARSAEGDGADVVELSVVVPAGARPLGEEHPGLAACTSLIHALGGALVATDAGDGGSHLVVRLPAVPRP